MAEELPDLEEVRELVRERIRHVMALDGEVPLDARFSEDLQADSLDLVEVIESVERRLADRGVTMELSDDELLTLTTVGQAAERIHASLRPGSQP